MEFNLDGSIKLSEKMLERRNTAANRMKRTMCVKIEKDVVNEDKPKKCVLHITLSDTFTDGSVCEKVYYYFIKESDTRTKLKKVMGKKWDLIIGPSKTRCEDCTKFVNLFRKYLDDNIIVKKGNCKN
jgi:hypothetical protein